MTGNREQGVEMTEREPMKDECREAFNRIWKRLEQGDDSFRATREQAHKHDVEITELRTNMNNLVKCLDSQTQAMTNLTKSIWGILVTLLMVGLGFIIWYIQRGR